MDTTTASASPSPSPASAPAAAPPSAPVPSSGAAGGARSAVPATSHGAFGGAAYVHGYSGEETARLRAQADVLAALLHDGPGYPAGSRVLEAGCGVGAQTMHLVAASPDAHVVALDRSAASLAEARARLAAHAPHARLEFRQADLYELPFAEGEFDHVFVCFVLEHLADPVGALAGLRRVLRPGGTITVIEGDHGSAFFHPASERATAAIDCLVALQAAAGGNGLIGRRVQPLLSAAGFAEVEVRPRTVYADETRPELVEGFTRNTFIGMVEGVREEAVAAGLSTAEEFARGLDDLRLTAGPGGIFHYTFFKGHAVKPAAPSAGRRAAGRAR
ncbi:methyltransferase domain-containing protein [Streptomyces hoynatensis]|uniref:Methyltransferase domain-containing protein n=1 Tax=Streptomyces hoynatensis TaxID=1141874 RepID=A0A3A9Z5V1_9ACTN|nr:methyltransferase domain-containing protein [Streptomyces hoynatensis]RKN43204.1 methyltransferase domain-containing protein [Streptomyces hoynatensis]